MNANLNRLSRWALDNRLKAVKTSAVSPAPASWVKAIRQALGMTTRQFAERLGVSQPRVVALEKAEQNRTITLDSLEKAAQALDCDLVYILVPRKPLEQIIQDQAIKAAFRLTAPTRHTMALEAQSNIPDDEREQIRQLSRDMIARGDKAIWDA